MSIRELRVTPLRYARNPQRRQTILDLDLNAVPPSENQDQEETSDHHGPRNGQSVQLGGAMPFTVIDLEAFDDDVIISSPRAFAEGNNHSRRNHGRNIVVDVDSEELSCRVPPNNRSRRRRVSANRTIINCDVYVNLEGSNNTSVKDNLWSVAPPPPSLPPPPKEPTFSCPVCMGPLVEEMSTKCGHIFCKACIKTAIAAQNKCPTCRRKVTMKDIIRIYLPATS